MHASGNERLALPETHDELEKWRRSHQPALRGRAAADDLDEALRRQRIHGAIVSSGTRGGKPALARPAWWR